MINEKGRWNLQENKPIPPLSYHMSHICCPVTAFLYRTFEKSVCIWALFNVVQITAEYNRQGVFFPQDMHVVSPTSCGAQLPHPATSLSNDRGPNRRTVTFRHIPYIQGVTGGKDQIREGVPYVKLYRKIPKHLYPKLNGLGDNGQW